jgi:hypothetical protein
MSKIEYYNDGLIFEIIEYQAPLFYFNKLMVVRLLADRISSYLDKLAEYYGYPVKIRMNNGAEFTGNTFTY